MRDDTPTTSNFDGDYSVSKLAKQLTFSNAKSPAFQPGFSMMSRNCGCGLVQRLVGHHCTAGLASSIASIDGARIITARWPGSREAINSLSLINLSML
jgi:hypothetical protein